MTIRCLFRWLALGVVTLTVAPTFSSIASASPRTVPPADSSEQQSGTSAPSDDGVVQSWALAPAGSADPEQAGNRKELSYQANPGDVIEDGVTVFNFGNDNLVVHVYATDAFNTPDGKFDLLAGDRPPEDVGTWLQLVQQDFAVPPGTQITVPFTLTVPQTASSGDHVGAVLASSVSVGSGANGQNVKLDRRTGTRLYVRVNGPLVSKVDVRNVDTTYHHAANPFAGSATVSFTVENTGNVRFGGRPVVTVGGPFGLGGSTVTMPDIVDLLPGEQVTLAAEVADVPALVLNRTVVRVEPDVVGDAGESDAVEATDLTFAPPVAIILVLLLAVLIMLALRALRRHRHMEDRPALNADTGDREPEPQVV